MSKIVIENLTGKPSGTSVSIDGLNIDTQRLKFEDLTIHVQAGEMPKILFEATMRTPEYGTKDDK